MAVAAMTRCVASLLASRAWIVRLRRRFIGEVASRTACVARLSTWLRGLCRRRIAIDLGPVARAHPGLPDRRGAGVAACVAVREALRGARVRGRLSLETGPARSRSRARLGLLLRLRLRCRVIVARAACVAARHP